MAGMLIASLWVATIMVFKSIKGFLNILNIKDTFNLKQTRGVIWPYWGQITPLIAISIFLGLKGISMELFITKCVCLFPFSINYAPAATWSHINRQSAGMLQNGAKIVSSSTINIRDTLTIDVSRVLPLLLFTIVRYLLVQNTICKDFKWLSVYIL